LERFAIIGFSGGSPYALACAYKLPNRLTTIALVGALAPTGAPGVMEGMSPAVSGLYALAQSNPDELSKTFAAVAPSPAALVATMSGSAGDWDRKVINARHSEFETEYAKTLRSGIEGVASDFVLASNNWGFPLKGITTETHLWCGTADCNTPPAMTNYVSSQLANSRTFMLPDEGHFALYRHWEEILERLI
jgi:pimeloyl-ACP methyl ester carboxylesterase